MKMNDEWFFVVTIYKMYVGKLIGNVVRKIPYSTIGVKFHCFGSNYSLPQPSTYL